MDSKYVLWLTSVSAWLWLAPGVVSAEPVQIGTEPEKQSGSVTTSAVDLLSSSPVEPLSAETLPIQTASVEPPPVEAISVKLRLEQASSLDEPTTTDPNVSAAASPVTAAEQPSHQQKDQAHPATFSGVRSDVSQSSPDDSSPKATPASSQESTAAGSPRRLYGESDPEAQPIADSDDPLEQLSTEEWLHLLSDETTLQPDSSDQAALTATASQSIPQPVLAEHSQPELLSQPLQSSQQTQTNTGRISYAAADLGTVSTSQTTSQLASQNRSLYRSTPNSLHESPFAAPLRELDQLASLFEPEPNHSVNPAINPSVALASTHHAASNRSLDDPVLADSMAQVTSVSQLSDVQPTDWAYQALQSLVERYGVIEGYPDGLFRGSRALSRFELAA